MVAPPEEGINNRVAYGKKTITQKGMSDLFRWLSALPSEGGKIKKSSIGFKLASNLHHPLADMLLKNMGRTNALT